MKLWLARYRGKSSWYHPEQFTREWEYEAAVDLVHLRHEPTAGNWHWWSNLYQVGWIMWTLITHCYPPQPPRAWPYAYEAEGDRAESVAYALPLENGWTYGMDLMNPIFGKYDHELRLQIMRCLDHEPSKRPDIRWLERVIEARVRSRDLVDAESDEQLKDAVAEIFRSPG